MAALLFPQFAPAGVPAPKAETRVRAIDVFTKTSLKATSLCAGETRSVEAEFAAEVASRCSIRARGGVRPGPYDGVREASAYLKDMGVSRARRVEILQSFDISTLRVESAGQNLFGLRFHGGVARPLGQFLTETFTSLTNRAKLALPPKWNAMSGLKQWQVRPGTTVFR